MNGNYSCFWAAVVARTISQKHFFMKASFSRSKWEFSQVQLQGIWLIFIIFSGEFFTYSGNSWLLMIKRSVKKIGRKSNSMEVYPPISKTASMHIVWKLLKMSHLNFWILAFSSMFCLIKTDLSGNTVWPRASGFQKLAKMVHLRHFSLTFVHSKCKRSSLRSQYWMRLFLWFSNTVP